MAEKNQQINSMSSGWIIKRPISISLHDNQITYVRDKKKYDVKFNDIAVIMLDATNQKHFRLVLTEISGRKTIIIKNTGSPNDEAFRELIVLLVKNMPIFNQFAIYEMASPIIGLLAAWFFLFASIGAIIGSLWAALVTQDLPTVFLPLTIVPITLAIVTPVLLAGRRQRVEPQVILATVVGRTLT